MLTEYDWDDKLKLLKYSRNVFELNFNNLMTL